MVVPSQMDTAPFEKTGRKQSHPLIRLDTAQSTGFIISWRILRARSRLSRWHSRKRENKPLEIKLAPDIDQIVENVLRKHDQQQLKDTVVAF